MHPSVLVPLDFSFDADRALPVAEALAKRIGARLDVVSLTSPGIDPVHDMAEACAHARRMGVDTASIHIRHDDDVVVGVLTVRDADHALLCCATHARGRLGEWLFNSISRPPDPPPVGGCRGWPHERPRGDRSVVAIAVGVPALGSQGPAWLRNQSPTSGEHRVGVSWRHARRRPVRGGDLLAHGHRPHLDDDAGTHPDRPRARPDRGTRRLLDRPELAGRGARHRRAHQRRSRRAVLHRPHHGGRRADAAAPGRRHEPSDATPVIAAAMASSMAPWPTATAIHTSGPPTASLSLALGRLARDTTEVSTLTA